MKVLLLDQYSEMGGAQHCLLDLLPALEECGWEAHAAAPPGGPLIERLRARGVRVHEIDCGPYQGGKKSATDYLRFPLDVRRQSRAISRLLDGAAFDLVYVNGPRLLPAVALSARQRVPVLFHAHHRIEQGSAARVAGWSLQRTAANVVACSNFVARSLRGYVARGRLHVVPNGTPDLGFRARAFGAMDGRWRIGVIGRISPEKGQAEFLQAAAMLKSTVTGAQFVICGEPLWAGRDYFEHVRALARGLPVDFLGWRHDMASVLDTLDLLVIPSRTEGLSRVGLEAFSAGVPVIAFAVGGMPEVIDDLENGFLVRERSPEALAARIREVMQGDAEIPRAIAANARRAWERNLTLAVYGNRIAALMQDLVRVPPVRAMVMSK